MVMNSHSIPLRIDLDPLKRWEQVAQSSQARNYMVLDLEAYWAALREQSPVPCFRPLNKQGQPRHRGRCLEWDEVQAIRVSLEEPRDLASHYGVDLLIIEHIQAG